ncbi:MAG: hypothetical protein AB1485_08285 [Candidatus Thermoplasmatota archaeon]
MITAKQHKTITKTKRWIIFTVIICCIIIVGMTWYCALTKTKKQEIRPYGGPYLMELTVYYHNDSINLIVWRVKEVGAFGGENWSDFRVRLLSVDKDPIYNYTIVLPPERVDVDDLIVVVAPSSGYFWLRIEHKIVGVICECIWEY